MKQLCHLHAIHVRSAHDADRVKVVQKDSRSSVHEAFHEARNLESRLKSRTSQLLKLVLTLNSHVLEATGNNVCFSLRNMFEKDYSTLWNLNIVTNTGKVIIKETIDSLKLVQVSVTEQIFPRNTVLFEFHDGFYMLESKKDIESWNSSVIKDSYSLVQFERIKSLQEGKNKLKNDLIRFIDQTSTALKEFKQLSLFDYKSKEIKILIRGIEASIIENSHQILEIKGKIYKVKKVLQEKLDCLQESRTQGKIYARECLKIRSLILLNRSLLFENYQKLQSRQKELIFETRRIFQIQENINNVKSRNDDVMSSGYGLILHLVSVLFGLVNLRPRYPMVLKGSRCSIIDYITETKAFPMYPLYLKGMDRSRFDYGVFLLNKNIQQLLKHFGVTLRTHQLRNTLHNINLIWDAVGQLSIVPVIIEDSEYMKRSLVLIDKRATSPLKADVWTESPVQHDSMFRID